MSKTIKFRELARRLTGISALGFGIQWQYTESERETVRRLLAFLEDRRALYVPTHIEVEGDVRWSIQAIREKCTETLGELPDGSASGDAVRAIRAACRKYMQSSEQRYSNIIALNPEAGHAASWLVALGELRASVGMQIAILALAHEIDLEEELAVILPGEDQE